jgi:iron-sulfur cluster repair protein YtfE (RIC family)
MTTKAYSAKLVPIRTDSSEGMGALLECYFQEHAGINEMISQIQILAKRIHISEDVSELLTRFVDMKKHAEYLVKALELHAKWEEDVFFPYFGQFCRLSSNPTLATSLWMLEKDHELSQYFFQGFFKLAEDGEVNGEYSPDFDRAKDQLLHACRLVKGHLEMEESIVVPKLGEFGINIQVSI